MVDRIEGDFEHQRFLHLADRAEALDRLVADEPVEPFQFLVGEAEIGLADRQQVAGLGAIGDGSGAFISVDACEAAANG